VAELDFRNRVWVQPEVARQSSVSLHGSISLGATVPETDNAIKDTDSLKHFSDSQCILKPF
jgi:hypothetical protein